MTERPRIRPGQAAPGWAEMWKPGRKSRLLGVVTDAWGASSLGNVRTVDRTLASGRRVGGKVLAQRPDKDGYPTVKLGGKPVRVAVLVQLAWAGPPVVRHLNGDRSDSRPGNLVYGSWVENEGDKKRGREEGNSSGCYRPFPPVTPVTGDLQR
jgi:hypothetical protein